MRTIYSLLFIFFIVGNSFAVDPPQVQIQATVNGDSIGVLLQWQPVAGADGYNIYGRTSLDSPAELLATVSGYQFFHVTAIDSIVDIPENMVFVEGGSFEMGDHFWEQQEGGDDEQPVHTVNLSSYYICETEVSNDEYNLIMNGGSGTNYPQANVNWYNTIKFCNLKSIAENRTPCYTVDGESNPLLWPASFTPDVSWNTNGYRLPTEAEWEYAARGGIHNEDNLRYSGCHEESSLGEYAWYGSNGGPGEIGTKLPNQLGIYNMNGNLWEWCWDWYDADYFDVSPVDNPHGPEAGSLKTGHGGAIGHAAHYSRVANRNFGNPASGYSWVGFRIALSAN